jgi:hypothetical protein
MVRLVDGTGGGGSVKTIEQIGRTYVPANPAWDQITAMLGEVPVVGACLGPVAGLGAVRVVTSHFSLMVRGSSQLFVAGPPVVERGVGQKVSKEELGGYEIHARGSGAVDNEVATEEEAFHSIRRFLAYLPSSVWQAPPRRTPDDDPNRRDEGLISAIPRDRRRAYDVRGILAAGLRPGIVLRNRLLLRPSSGHRIGAPPRLSGGRDGQRSSPRRWRAQRGGLRQDDPAGGYLRHVPFAGSEFRRQPRLSDWKRR